MKTLIKIAACLVITVCLFTLCVSAIEEGDYGYYDITADGKIEIIDALGILQQVVDNKHESGGLLRVIRTLKLVTAGKVVTAIITEIDEDNETVKLLNESGNYAVPMQKIGFDENYNLDFYLDGTVTMTVSGDFITSKDASLIHAASASCLYDINELHLTADSATALLNGEEQTLSAPTIIEDGELMVTADLLAQVFEASVSWDTIARAAIFEHCGTVLEMAVNNTTATLSGETVTMKVPMVVEDSRVYIPAAFVAEAFGAKATFYADTNTLVIVKRFLPIFAFTDAEGNAGEEVSVTLSLLHNPGVAGLQVECEYDSSVLSYVSAQTVSNGMFANASPTAGANPFKYVAAHLGLKVVKGDLTLATVNFKIPETAAAGKYFISDNSVQMYTVHNGDIYELNAISKPFSITVTE